MTFTVRCETPLMGGIKYQNIINTFAKFKSVLRFDNLSPLYRVCRMVKTQYIDCNSSQNKIGEGIDNQLYILKLNFQYILKC